VKNQGQQLYEKKVKGRGKHAQKYSPERNENGYTKIDIRWLIRKYVPGLVSP